MNEQQKLQSFDEDREITDNELDQESEITFYATGNDGKVIKLHNRIASVPISFGGKEFEKELEEEMKNKTDEEIMALAPFEIIGRGIAGIEEMSKAMDDNRLFFGLLQIQIGDGTFARYKNIFIHFQGDKMKILDRARGNKRLALAKELIGHTHAPLIVCNKLSFTVEFVFNELKRIFQSDNIVYKSNQQNDLNTLKSNYQNRMEKVKVEAEQERKQLIVDKVRLKREAKEKAIEEERQKLLELEREAAQKKQEMEEEKKRKAEEERRLRYEREEKERLEMEKIKLEQEKQRLESEKESTIKKKKKKGKKCRKKKDDWSDDKPWTGPRVLAAIHAEISPFNWGLFKPSQKEIKAIKWGHGSLNVLRQELKDDEVLYGLMRLSFGANRFRRSHWVYFLWTPDTMSEQHKKNRLRMKHVSYNGKMQDLLSPWTISLTVTRKEKVTINDWILRVKKTVVVDGGDELFSEETFQKALQEESKYINKLKEKELKLMQQRKEKQEMEKIEEMKEATRKRKEKADKKQSNVFTKIELKQVLNSIKIKNSKTPTIDVDGNYYINHNIDYNVDNKQEIMINEENKENEFEDMDSSDEDNAIVPEPQEFEIIIELNQQELAILEEERQKKEAEQHAKLLENEIKYRKVLQSKMVLESVELVKRTSEKLCWILFAPRSD